MKKSKVSIHGSPTKGLKSIQEEDDSEDDSVVGHNKEGHVMVASENVILIKPTVDASNKQLHYKNDFRFAGKNFDKFLSQNENYEHKGFRPTNLGKHSKVVGNIKLNVKDANVIEPDFTRNMYGECGRLE